MQSGIIQDKLLLHHSHKMSDILKQYLLSSNTKISQNSQKLPPISLTMSYRNSPRHKRSSRLYSYGEEPSAYISSRINVSSGAQPLDSSDFQYKSLSSPLKQPKLKIPDHISGSDASPSLCSAQTLKLKYPSLTDTLKVKKMLHASLYQYIDDNLLIFQEIVKKKDFEKLLYYFNFFIRYAQEQRNLKLFSQFFYFIAHFANLTLHINKATFLLKELLTLSELSRNHFLKIKTLIEIWNIAKQLKQYESAQKIISKALQYAWADDFEEQEIDCYDKLGLSYFYLGNTTLATHYHNKWAKGEIEPKNSYYRNTSKEFIRLYEKNLPLCLNFDDVLFRYLHIPFINIFTGTNFDSESTLTYSNAIASIVLDSIISGIEFKHYNLEYHSIQLQKRIALKKAELPRRAIEIMQKYKKNKDNYIFDHKIHENPLYHLPLQQKVDYRKAKSFSLDSVEINVKKYVSQQREPFKKSAQIYVKESTRKDLLPQNSTMLTLYFKNLLISLIETSEG